MKLKIAKEFLKANQKKIVIFVVTSILVSLLPIYPCELEIHGTKSLPLLEIQPGTKLVPIYRGIFSSIMREDILDYQECGISNEIWWTSCKCNYLFFLPFSLIVIVLSYLLSCFIIWIYNKVRIWKK